MSSESGERRPARARAVESRPPLTAEMENLPCPRCHSTNTKFCYYNNYNLSQPRHFCKSCRRYWTRGGTLRNVPVGGGTRRPSSHKRSRAATSSSSAALSPTHSGSAAAPAVLELCTGSGREVNLNEAVPEPVTGSFTSLLCTPPVDGGVEFVPLSGFEFGLSFYDWPMEDVGGGNVTGWQMGGGELAEGGLGDVGDCFGWPELAISGPSKKS